MELLCNGGSAPLSSLTRPDLGSASPGAIDLGCVPPDRVLPGNGEVRDIFAHLDEISCAKCSFGGNVLQRPTKLGRGSDTLSILSPHLRQLYKPADGFPIGDRIALSPAGVSLASVCCFSPRISIQP